MTTINGNDFGFGNTEFRFRVRDPISALTHFIGFILSITAMPLLLIRASDCGQNVLQLTSYAVFMTGMIILYGASSAYHSFNISDRCNLILKKIDHCSIFILIAASYAPVCIVALNDSTGMIMLTVIFAMAAAGIIFKLFFVTCPRWVSSVIYTAMGWACVMIIPELLDKLNGGAFAWLLAGGIFYSVGAVIYALKLPLFRNRMFGNHELFHCFVLAGSLCHYMMMFLYLCRF